MSAADTTRFTSVPISGTVIETVCPAWRVYESGGTRPVPVSSTLPSGTGLSRMSQRTSSSKRRRIRAVEVSPAKTSPPAASTIRMWIASGASQSSGTYTAGPIEQAFANTFAWGRYSGLAPSMSRDDTSLPIV